MLKDYKALTTYNSLKHESIQEFVDALRRLEDLGIFKHVGSDSNGTLYYMVFGYKYPSVAD